jgi:hypothetical protein
MTVKASKQIPVNLLLHHAKQLKFPVTHITLLEVFPAYSNFLMMKAMIMQPQYF